MRSPDTDILMILLHHALSIPINIYLDTGCGQQRQLVNVTNIASSRGQEQCTMLLGLYVFTKEDVNSTEEGFENCKMPSSFQVKSVYNSLYSTEIILCLIFLLRSIYLCVVL